MSAGKCSVCGVRRRRIFRCVTCGKALCGVDSYPSKAGRTCPVPAPCLRATLMPALPGPGERGMTDTLTHAYTVRQPFAYATAMGWKPIENKTERPPLALMGKLVGIHAGLQWARESDLPSWAKSYEMPAPTDSRLVYGALIGVARLVGVVRALTASERRARTTINGGVSRPSSDFAIMLGRSAAEVLPIETCDRIRPWWRGPWGWLLEEAVLLPEPIPMRGQQGLWRLPDFALEHQDYLTGAEWALEQWRKARETR